MSESLSRIAKEGLWSNNIVFSQSIALCPLGGDRTMIKWMGWGRHDRVLVVCNVDFLRPLAHTFVEFVFVALIAMVAKFADMVMNACCMSCTRCCLFR